MRAAWGFGSSTRAGLPHSFPPHPELRYSILLSDVYPDSVDSTFSLLYLPAALKVLRFLATSDSRWIEGYSRRLASTPAHARILGASADAPRPSAILPSRARAAISAMTRTRGGRRYRIRSNLTLRASTTTKSLVGRNEDEPVTTRAIEGLRGVSGPG